MRYIAKKERGAALFFTMVIVTMVLALLLTSMTLVSTKSAEAVMSTELLQARNVADAGLEYAVFWLREAMKIWGTFDVFDKLDPNPADDIYTGATQIVFAQPQDGQVPGKLEDTTGKVVGEYDVYLDVRDRTATDHRIVVVRSCAYYPSKAAFLAGAKHAYRKEIFAQLRLRQVDARPGNYGYFINHWGWFYGSTITANGSVRANGYFSMKYDPTINGSPVFGNADGWDLQDKENNGGIFAGLDIVGTCRGMGALPENRYPFQDPVVMPNISNLSYYKKKAKEGGSLTVSGTEVTKNGIYGDEPGETGYLYLEGTPDDPIRINGIVVVEKDVIIKGYVTGKGTLIAGRNLYIADDVKYLNGPNTPRPSGTTETEIEAWLQENLDKDFVGFYAREHIVAGDWTDSNWQGHVFSWLKDDMNRGDEDAGLDGIHNTGDTGEDDGKWTVEHYTLTHSILGLIPPGSSVGDVIPGSGEDLDGDGVYDPRITTDEGWLNQLKTEVPLDPSHWGGNLPDPGAAGSWNYSDIATNDISQFDGCFYTNHAFAGLLRASDTIRFNGGLISRNEAIVYSPRIEFNHDERLSGRSWEDMGIVGGGGRVWDDIVVEAYWTGDDSPQS